MISGPADSPPVCPPPSRPTSAGRPAGARSDPLSKLFAVYLLGRQDQSPAAPPVDDGAPIPPHSLLGLCRDFTKAERIASRLRRREALIGCSAYDPYQFVPPSERPHLTRREAHRVAIAGAAARRAELGLA
jgi:hypothetical protein